MSAFSAREPRDQYSGDGKPAEAASGIADGTAAPDRYSRQVLFEPIGDAGQQRLLNSRVTLIGCGALGTVIASTLVRAGIGNVRICDRDYIEFNNLQRQVLFDEDDIARNLPKAVAAADKLRRINSGVAVEPLVTDVNIDNIERLVADADVILDGTDNFETRYLINDIAIKLGKPWVYGAVIGATGLVMPVIPGQTACLRCVFESAPPPEMSPTCDTAGVIGPAVNIVASLQCVAAIKILIGSSSEISSTLTNIDTWTGRLTQLNINPVRSDKPCPCCGQRNFEYLTGERTSSTTTLCGRNAVQIRPARSDAAKVDFDAIAAKLATVAREPVARSKFMIKADIGEYTITVFPDGRAIVKGTKLADEARSVYARYIGH
ncbi:MAG: ThiF family adenylyltransferase [Phycisphaerales bacterium]|nr:ThiF family adenylyltransferase [Phycisphaerales bacterium]